MGNLETRNRYFDELANTPGLIWMGQNTNHIPAHPAVSEAMVRTVEAQEHNVYAPPLGFDALRRAINADLGVAGMSALVTEGGVNAIAAVCRATARPGTSLVTTRAEPDHVTAGTQFVADVLYHLAHGRN